jgi:signal transduction histidine kinase
LVQSFQQALDNVKNNKGDDGISDYERILSRYIPAMYVTNAANKNRALAFLNEAVAYANDNGIEKALREFNNRSGSFVRGDLYIFAYDFNGTNLAHPIRPELIGQKGLLDINDVNVISREIALAKRGGGAMYLVFPNPIHEAKDELKLIYIKNINNSLYLGSGLYLSNISADFGEEDREELVAFVEEARRFAHENGKEKASEVFNDPKGNFTKDGRYIFAYDYDGRTLALPYQPELIGTSRITVKDPNGVEINQQAIDAAKFGNGFFYYIYPDPSKNMTPALKLGYVVDIDDTWYLGSGIYADGDEETD